MAVTAETIQAKTTPDWLKPWLKRETWVAWLFILPSMIGFIVFYAVPTVRGLLI